MPYLTLAGKGSHAWAPSSLWLTSKSEFVTLLDPVANRHIHLYGYRRVWRCLRCRCGALGSELLSETAIKAFGDPSKCFLRAGPVHRDWFGEPTCSDYLRRLSAMLVLDS